MNGTQVTFFFVLAGTFSLKSFILKKRRRRGENVFVVSLAFWVWIFFFYSFHCNVGLRPMLVTSLPVC